MQQRPADTISERKRLAEALPLPPDDRADPSRVKQRCFATNCKFREPASAL